MSPASIAGMLALTQLAAATGPLQTVLDLGQLGLSRAQQEPARPEITLYFPARADQALAQGELKLLLGAPPAKALPVSGLEVLLNGERLARIERASLGVRPSEHRVAIDSRLLAERNALTLRLLGLKEASCSAAPVGAWKMVKGGELVLESRTIAFPDDLAMLDLPFVDKDFDRIATVQLVLPGALKTEHLRLAAILAGRFGMNSPVPLRFSTRQGALPPGHSVVLLDGAAAANELGLPAPSGPSIRMANRAPDFADPGKLLILAGRDLTELATAVRHFARADGLAGREVEVKGPPPPTPRVVPYRGPRWLPPGELVPFSRYPDLGPLSLEGARSGRIEVGIRIAPDLWIWPEESVDLELGYGVELPESLQPPRLDVSLNGQFLSTLPALAPGRSTGRARLRIRRQMLRGYNQLLLHVRYPEEADCAATLVEARVWISPDSVLHLEKFGHFASLPDLSRMVHDGYPFTRLADLGETALVLPANPRHQEVDTVLSLVSHFASVTGTPPLGVAVLTPEAVLGAGALDRDLLVVGLPEDNALLRAWSERLPVRPAKVPEPQMPVQNQPLLALLKGEHRELEVDRARPLLASTRGAGLVAAIESPLAPGRMVTVITATGPESLPGHPDLAGFARSERSDGDLLVATGGERWMFRIGPSFDRGQLPRTERARWFLASHWVLLLPAIVLGSVLGAVLLRAGLLRRVQRRLEEASR